MNRLFDQMREELPAYAGAAIGRLDEPAGVSWDGGSAELTEGGAALIDTLSGWRTAFQDLGGRVDVGSDDEVLISASKLYLLARIDHRTGRFILVALKSSGNIGYLRFRIRQWMRDAKEAA